MEKLKNNSWLSKASWLENDEFFLKELGGRILGLHSGIN